MHLHFNASGHTLCVSQDPDDTHIKDTSHLLYAIKRKLNREGYDVIKKRAWKDGHLISDTEQYLRSRIGFTLMIWDSQYQIRDLAKDYKATGKVVLRVERATEN